VGEKSRLSATFYSVNERMEQLCYTRILKCATIISVEAVSPGTTEKLTALPGIQVANSRRLTARSELREENTA